VLDSSTTRLPSSFTKPAAYTTVGVGHHDGGGAELHETFSFVGWLDHSTCVCPEPVLAMRRFSSGRNLTGIGNGKEGSASDLLVVLTATTVFSSLPSTSIIIFSPQKRAFPPYGGTQSISVRHG
jgi:hypothetical protein